MITFSESGVTFTILQETFLSKIEKPVKVQESYPERLLPKTNYKIITEDLPEDFYLLRHTEAAELIEVDDFGRTFINREAIIPLTEGTEKQLYDLSTNLFGNFEYDDIKYRITNREITIKYWESPTDCLTVNSISYDIVYNRKAIFFKVSELHKKVIPSAYKKNLKGNEHTFDGEFRVVHKPMVYNFWHYEIQFWENGTTKLKRNSSAFIKSVDAVIISTLKKYGFIELPQPKLVNEKLYIND